MNKQILDEKERLLYVDLPVLLHKILYLSRIPLPTCEEFVKVDIEEIKKITNAECNSALENFNIKN